MPNPTPPSSDNEPPKPANLTSVASEYPLPPVKPKTRIEAQAEHRESSPRRIGKRPILNDEMIDSLVDLLKRGNYLGVSAKYVGINPGTLSIYLRKGQELIDEDRDDYDDVELLYVRLAREVEKARAWSQVKMVEVIRQAAQSQWQAAAWYLERTDNQNWGRTVRAEVTGEGGGAIQIDTESVMRKLEAVTQRVVEAEEIAQDAEIVSEIPAQAQETTESQASESDS